MTADSPAVRGVIEAQILAFLVNEVRRGSDWTPDPDENLLTGEYIDSIDIMRLVAHLETTFRVPIPPADLIPENFRTVRVMAAYIAQLGAYV